MIQETPPAQKKNFCVMEDVYGEMVVVTNGIDLEKESAANTTSTSSSSGSKNGGGIGQLRFQFPDVGRAMTGFVRTREVGEFLSGALAGAMTKAVLAPLETIRTRMVVGVGSRHIAGSFIEVMEQRGWQGLWAGNTVNMLRIVPTQAIELGTFECVKRAVTSAKEDWEKNGCPKVQIGRVRLSFSFSWLSPTAVGGAAAGIVSTLACHPLEVLKLLLHSLSWVLSFFFLFFACQSQLPSSSLI
ncbi:hypothetical protein MKW94_009209 [Papaver nudicaule]|uniref:Uncharacterized protein n=1 Tax=Papaver nudicaule TaxID=74823 RepID=A0AA41V3M6_PAPNU|nr:hypothetical protein [Papaver nudicaule]